MSMASAALPDLLLPGKSWLNILYSHCPLGFVHSDPCFVLCALIDWWFWDKVLKYTWMNFQFFHLWWCLGFTMQTSPLSHLLQVMASLNWIMSTNKQIISWSLYKPSWMMTNKQHIILYYIRTPLCTTLVQWLHLYMYCTYLLFGNQVLSKEMFWWCLHVINFSHSQCKIIACYCLFPTHAVHL